MSRFTYPHTIDNGAGERITFLRRIERAKGDRLEVESSVAPGAGPVMHVHHRQDESITVQSGRLAYQRLGESVQYAEAGQTATFLRGEAHRFWNAGDVDLICTGYIEPADSIEYFLSEIFDSQKRAASTRPKLFDVAYLAHRFRAEYQLMAIPLPVQRVLFPVLVFVGSALGLYSRYANAPEPVRRR